MSAKRIAALSLDDAGQRRSPEAEHELNTALADLLQENIFSLKGAPGPYAVRISIKEERLRLAIMPRQRGSAEKMVTLPLAPFKPIIRDYALICESYYATLKHAGRGQIEAMDMGRRAMHNEGAEMLKEALETKIDIDFTTARRLFTLMFALHVK